jgi:uncharacterized RDD family membrane protein YckC
MAPDNGWTRAFIAILIDYCIAVACIGLITAVLFVIGSMLPMPVANRVIIPVFLGTMLIVFAGYWPFFKITRNGQTPGRRIVGLAQRQPKAPL